MPGRSIEQIIERQMRRWDRMAATLGYEPGHRMEGTGGPLPEEAVTLEPVICISRDLGSGTREVAAGLAEALGYEVFDREIIDHIAADLNVQRRLIEHLDERLRSNIEAVVEGFLRDRTVTDRDHFEALVRVVQAVARRGGVILLGRGAHLIVGEQAALRVRLTAPIEHRVRYLMDKDHIDESEAWERIEKMDRQRRDFLRRLFRTSPDDPNQFDLILNTARIPPPACVEVIRAVLRMRGVEVGVHGP